MVIGEVKSSHVTCS